MKHTVVLFAVAFLALSIAGPAIGPANDVAWGAPVIDDDQETPPPPPKGVSPAHPDIELPNVDVWYCSQCGAENRFPKRHIKKPFHRPMLGSRADAGDGPRAGADVGCCARRGEGPCAGADACCRAGRGDGACAGRCGDIGPPRGKSGRNGKRFHGRGQGRHGQGRIVAAERILKSSAELDLTEEQTAKLETLSYETKKKLIDLHADIEKEQLEVRNGIRSGTNDLTQIKRHLNAIAKAQVGLEEARIANLFEARKVLTDEQKKLLKEKHPRLGMTLD